MTKEQRFIEEIESIRASLTIRVDMLHKHCEEYKEEGKPQLAKDSDLKAKQFILVINNLDNALAIVG